MFKALTQQYIKGANTTMYFNKSGSEYDELHSSSGHYQKCNNIII